MLHAAVNMCSSTCPDCLVQMVPLGKQCLLCVGTLKCLLTISHRDAIDREHIGDSGSKTYGQKEQCSGFYEILVFSTIGFTD